MFNNTPACIRHAVGAGEKLFKSFAFANDVLLLPLFAAPCNKEFSARATEFKKNKIKKSSIGINNLSLFIWYAISSSFRLDLVL